ncbi:MAG TPA: response regulator transcription factor [Aggregatilinea sp.]|jgi:two-component system alkaline phosphatase synthesis response regulator PhoP|uniref:response regulator transcription factor n=1 Tax=Aggregatilinea sp. TaxID=2806333 RepID=UPI002C3413C4|nr:response regulator transcription factor [Aggregatilinea sp.]HML24928.1 response regulator transcription factor [Aggregatilinea sp.]
MTSNGEDAHILVVDDEGAIRYSISKTLQRVGYQVQTASSGEEALEMMQQQEYDVVLTDIRMPGLSGVELLAKIKERAPDAVVILLTGYANLESAIESLRLGAHDYLTKPSSSQSIRDSVAQGVERARNLKSRRVLLRTIQENVEALAGETASEPSGTHHSDGAPSSTPVVTPVTTMTIGPLTIFPGRYQISVGDQPIDLTPTEFDLLLYLAAHRGRVVPCSELVREVRGYTLEEHEAREVIRPHVSNLRRKLKSSGQNPNIIVNVRGIGYRLSEPS